MQFTLILAILLLANSCLAVDFNCDNLDAAVCKRKLADTFNAEFKSLHHDAFRKFCQTYMNISSKVHKELDKDYLMTGLTDLAIRNVAKDLTEFNENINDEKKVAEISHRTIDHMEFTYEKGSLDPEPYRKICKKYKLRESLTDVVKELTMNIGKLWKKLYSNLRAADLKAYPEYDTINASMIQLEKISTSLNETSTADSKKAFEKIGISLDIPFYDAIIEIS